jgi:MoxR-like ATPase
MKSSEMDAPPASDSPVEAPAPERAAALFSAILDELEKAVIGKRGFLEKLLAAAVAEGHVLIEDKPGLAKTLAARSLAQVLGHSFKRIQFTPDLLPSDITGAYVLERNTGDLRLIQGPVFANFVLADEVNRAPPKTQSALLEAMEERQTTLEGTTLRLPSPFMVVATQNPIEYEGTFPLPEAQLDRFLVKLEIGYPGRDDEVEMAMRRFERREENPRLAAVGENRLGELIAAAAAVHVERDVARYAADIARATRASARVAVGASPRATLALLKLARVRALMEGRSFAIPDDVKRCAFEVLIHRVILRPDAWAVDELVADVVRAAVESVRVPKTERE